MKMKKFLDSVMFPLYFKYCKSQPYQVMMCLNNFEVEFNYKRGPMLSPCIKLLFDFESDTQPQIQ